MAIFSLEDKQCYVWYTLWEERQLPMFETYLRQIFPIRSTALWKAKLCPIDFRLCYCGYCLLLLPMWTNHCLLPSSVWANHCLLSSPVRTNNCLLSSSLWTDHCLKL